MQAAPDAEVTADRDRQAAATAFGQLPVRFEANRGQIEGEVDYLVRGKGFTAFLTGDEVVTALSGDAAATVRMRLEGADADAKARPLGDKVGESSYLRGSPKDWIRSAPSFDRIGYDGLWPGVDGVYRSAEGGFEYDFVVAPGADPRQISLGFTGDVKAVRVETDGGLAIDTPAGKLRHEPPVTYQDVSGRRVAVESRYAVTDSRVRFDIGSYDPSRPLVIDPVVVFSTFLGGPVGEAVHAIAVNNVGQVTVAGVTNSDTFPLQSPLQAALNGTANDAFVTKFTPAGNGLVYSTFLGGSGADAANGLALDGEGNAYVTGTTGSTNFPTVNPIRAAKEAATTSDVFVAKLNAAGNALVYSTYLGGNHNDIGNAIAIDGAGGARVTGSTSSTDFSVVNAADATFGGGICPTSTTGAGATAPCTDGFVAILNPAGTALAYASYLGGSRADSATGIAVDPAGNAHVAGFTGSADFATVAPVDATFGGGTCPTNANPAQPCTDAFVVKLPPAGTPVTYATYLGGDLDDRANAIAVDPTGAAYVTGAATSTTFPTANAIQAAKSAGQEADVFVTKLAPSGSALVYSTYLGGLEFDSGSAIAVDSTGSAHVSGIADSELFPVVRPVARFGGNEDAFIARLHPSGGSLLFSTHYGGIGSENARAIAVDGAQNTYIGGNTAFARVPEYFPIVNALQGTFGGGFVSGTPNSGDGFVVRLEPDAPAAPVVTKLTPRAGPAGGGTAVVIEGIGFSGATAVRFGTTPARSFSVQSDQRIVAVSPTLPLGIARVNVTTGGGISRTNPVSEFTAGEGSWALTGSLNTPRSAHTTTLLQNGKVLVAGGRVSSAGIPLASAELYDPLTGVWQTTGSMAAGRWSHTANLLFDGRVLVAGGFNTGSSTLKSAEIYNPATGTWSAVPDMVGSRGLHASAILRGTGCGASCGRVVVAGGRFLAPGQTTTNLSTTEVYNPQLNAWETAGNLKETRHTTEATSLPDGRAFIAGGFGPTDTAETFDGTTKVWTATANVMTFSRARPTVTLMTDGNVLVNNGWASGPVPGSDVFDYRTNSFRRADTPITHRWNATAVSLPDGRVMALAGGVGGPTAEAYDPRTDDFRHLGMLQNARGALPGASGGVGGTAVVLSSSTTEYRVDRAVCGSHCGKVLIVGNSDDPATELYTPAGTPPGEGYWLAASDGGIFSYGGAQFYGSTGGIPLNQPIVSITATPTGRGYWLVASDGGVFNFGDAAFHGSTGGIPLNQPIVGMAPTRSGKGYWLVASDGGIFAFGDAAFHGSTGGTPLNRPVVAMAPTRSGNGYWLTASDGGIFAFGDAAFHGSTGGTPLNRPVVGMAPTRSGNGYWLVASDGGIFAFGDAPFHGSTGGIPLVKPVVGMSATPAGNGYWLVASDGGIFAFGDAAFHGSAGGLPLNRPVVAMTPSP